MWEKACARWRREEKALIFKPSTSLRPRTPGVRALVLAVTLLASGFLVAGVVATWRLGGKLQWSAGVTSALPALALLGCGSYGFRFLRWHSLARRLAPRLPWLASLRIYMSGFSLGLTPGRFGELVKFTLLRRASGVPEVESVAILPIEAATEVLSFVALALAAATVAQLDLPRLGASVTVAAVLIIGLLLLAPIRWALAHHHVRVHDRFPRLERLVKQLLALGGLRPLLVAQGYAFAARLCDATLFWSACHAVGLAILPGSAALAWGVSGLAGGLSLLPGGVGVVEGALVATVVRFGGGASPALAAALLSRLFTLWLWIPLGLWLAATADGANRRTAAVTAEAAGRAARAGGYSSRTGRP